MNSRVKTLFVSPAADVYGSERSMLSLLKFRNFAADVVCPSGGELERQLIGMGIKIFPQEFGKYSVKQNPFWHAGFLFRILRIIKKSRPDVLVVNLDGNTALVMLAALLSGVPVIRYCRFEFNMPSSLIERWCWYKAAAVICPSDWVCQQVINWFGSNTNVKVFRLYDAYAGSVPPGESIEVFRNQFFQGSEMAIGCIGRLHPGKRIETAIESFAIIRGKGSNARLFIIGADDGSEHGRLYYEGLKGLTYKLHVAEFVTFIGYIPYEQVPAVLHFINVLLMPSESESFGMVLMEAWANGVPTVASDVSGCREITLASRGGLLTPVGDANRMAELVIDLFENHLVSKSMGQSGQKWVLDNCEPLKYAENFGAVIKHSLKRNYT